MFQIFEFFQICYILIATDSDTVEKSKTDTNQVAYITKPRGPQPVRKRTIEELKQPAGRNEPGPATLAAYNRINGTTTRGQPEGQPERKRAKNVTQTKNSEEITSVYIANKLPMICKY